MFKPIKIKMKYNSLDLKADEELMANTDAELRNLTGRGGQIVDESSDAKARKEAKEKEDAAKEAKKKEDEEKKAKEAADKKAKEESEKKAADLKAKEEAKKSSNKGEKDLKSK